jgi:hypothetical protein
LDEKQLKELIKRIVLEVIRRLTGFGECRAIALVPGYSAYTAEAAEYLSGKSACGALFGDAEPLADIDSKRVETADDKKALMRTMRDAEEVVLVAPSMSLLTAVAQGDDTHFEAVIFEKALLDGKKATVLLDFQPPRFRRGTLYEKVISAVDAVRDMGAEVVYLGVKPEDGYALITEFEVNEAAKRGIARLQCAPGAIVTPLARDAAAEKGVAIDI